MLFLIRQRVNKTSATVFVVCGLTFTLLLLQLHVPLTLLYHVPTEVRLPPTEIGTNFSRSEFFEEKISVQAQRLSLLARECKKLPTIRKGSWQRAVDKVAKSSIVLEKFRVSNCVVLKAGSSAWHSLIAHLFNTTDLIEKKQTYKIAGVLQPTRERFRQVVTASDFIRFLVVREPLSRLLSAYRDRILDISHPSWQASHYVPLILQYTRGIKYTQDDMFYTNKSVKITPSFQEFVRYITSSAPSSLDPHWMPISLACRPCVVNYTAVVHMETFLPDINYILRASGMSEEADTKLLVLHAHKGKGNTEDLLISYYSTLGSQLMKRVLQLYEEDFRLFGYDPTEILRKIDPTGHSIWRT